MTVTATVHSKKRMRQRLGRQQSDGAIKSALESQEHSPTVQYLQERANSGAIVKLFAGYIYIFKKHGPEYYRLLTVFPHRSLSETIRQQNYNRWYENWCNK
jgi:hypothetical protein